MTGHLVDTYQSEIAKTASVWRCFADADLDWRPHAKSATAGEIMKHELLSGRRFFAEFLASPEPPASEVLSPQPSVETNVTRLLALAEPRVGFLAAKDADWWQRRVRFFDVERERIWIFWRRVLHTAHHRTQLTVYLRLMDKPVPSTYGPTADVTWQGADPTLTVAAAEGNVTRGEARPAD